jgi:hypothetical protein
MVLSVREGVLRVGKAWSAFGRELDMINQGISRDDCLDDRILHLL